MADPGYHEPFDRLSRKTVDMHRALRSLQEELEAVDWYRQRADATQDETLRDVLLHNMREEIEHASMVLEWLRRNDADFDQQLRTYLFTEGNIAEIEEQAEEGKAEAAVGQEAGQGGPGLRLTVGSMKGGERE